MLLLLLSLLSLSIFSSIISLYLSAFITCCRYALTVWFSAAPQRPAPPSPEPAQINADSIFVSIAAFRDPETRWTVCDLFAQAARPDRLRVGVVWQVDPEADAGLLHIPCAPERRRQVGGPARGHTLFSTRYHAHAPTSMGCCTSAGHRFAVL